MPRGAYSEDVEVGVVGQGAEAEDVGFCGAVSAETIDLHAVLGGVNEVGEAVVGEVQLAGIEMAFEDGVLDADSEVLEGVSEAGAATVVGDVVGDEDQHGKRKLS